VAAIFGGESIIRASTGATVTIPPTDSTVVIMGFTDDNGDYQLGPAAYEQHWIVTAAYPGHYADAVVVNLAGSDATGVNLLLKPDPAATEPSTVTGSVSAKGGGTLAGALVAAEPDVLFAPAVDPVRVTALQTQVGAALLAQPWFRWASIATNTSGSGAYNLLVPSGAFSVYGFKYGYKAPATDLTLGTGETQSIDFTLSK
jgi:hypothetical protein